MNPYFKTRLNFDSAREMVWKELSEYFQRYIPESSTILELGSGYCHFINFIRAKEKHALDLFEDIKKYADNNVITHIMSATELSKFKSESFDVIFASNFFEHLEINDLQNVLAQCFRILKTDGKLMIMQPNFKYAYKEYFDDYTHKTILTDVSLSDMLKGQGFDIKKNIKKFFPYSLKSKAPKMAFLVWLYLRCPIKPFAKQMFILAQKINHKV